MRILLSSSATPLTCSEAAVADVRTDADEDTELESNVDEAGGGAAGEQDGETTEDEEASGQAADAGGGPSEGLAARRGAPRMASGGTGEARAAGTDDGATEATSARSGRR